MEEMTIKQYADSRGKSVQSVYQQMNRKRIKDPIKEHIKEVVINNTSMDIYCSKSKKGTPKIYYSIL